MSRGCQSQINLYPQPDMHKGYFDPAGHYNPYYGPPNGYDYDTSGYQSGDRTSPASNNFTPQGYPPGSAPRDAPPPQAMDYPHTPNPAYLSGYCMPGMGLPLPPSGVMGPLPPGMYPWMKETRQNGVTKGKDLSPGLQSKF